MIEASLLLLAGGQSSRMGRSKPLLPVGGTTLIEWQVARLRPAFKETLIAVADPEQLPATVRELAVVDGSRGAGPLAGLEAGLAAAALPEVFALASDLPRAGGSEARLLQSRIGDRDAAVPSTPRGPEPLCALYRRERALPAIRAALEAGDLRLQALLERLDVVHVEAEPFAAALQNLNSPADYEAFLGARRP